MKLESYWLDTAPTFNQGEQAVPPGHYDVAIIGGGYTGLSAAVELAKQGASVILFEANRIAGEASGRNGGQCNAGLAHDFGVLASKIGIEKARAFYLSYVAAVDSIEALVQEEQIECDFARRGRLKLAAKPGHYDKLSKAYERLSQDVDPNVELLSAAQVRDELGTDRFYGGLLQTTSAQMHMGRFAVGLANSAVKHGAKLCEYTPILDIKQKAINHFQLISGQSSVSAEKVLIATGNSAIGPFQYFRRRMVSVGSFIIVTQPLEDHILARILLKRRCYVTSKNIGHYFRITPDNRLLFGGRARFAISNPRSDAKSGRILQTALTELFPELGHIGIDYCWGGLVDMTADRLPRAGQHKGMYYSLGYSGHGVQMSVHMGRVMAHVMAGNEQLNPWRELSWPPVPGHLGKPWFLPFVGAYYRFQDLIH